MLGATEIKASAYKHLVMLATTAQLCSRFCGGILLILSPSVPCKVCRGLLWPVGEAIFGTTFNRVCETWDRGEVINMHALSYLPLIIPIAVPIKWTEVAKIVHEMASLQPMFLDNKNNVDIFVYLFSTFPYDTGRCWTRCNLNFSELFMSREDRKNLLRVHNSTLLNQTL